MKKLLLVLIVGLSLPAFAAKTQDSLTGTYDCKATELDAEAKIPGTMSLTKTGQTYAVKSAFDDNTSYVGTGIYNPANRSFSFIFTDEKTRQERGIVVAEVKGNSKLESSWTYLDKSSIGHWNCSKQSA